MTSILAKMGDGTHIVDVSDLFTLDTTAVAGNAILTNLKADQTSGLQKTQISNSLGQAVGVTGAPVVGTESGLITRPIFPEGANAIALESTQLTGNGTLTTINTTLGTLATQSTLALIKLKTDNLDVLLSTRSSEATLSTLNGKITNLASTPIGTESGTLVRQVGPLTVLPGSASGQTQVAFSATLLSATLLASNTSRSAVIVDCSSCVDDIYLNLVGAPASSSTGMRVYAGSRFDTSGLGPLPTGIITVVSNSGTQTVKVIEFSR
jgi:hypothetical protein